jgi:hypothetical protein
MHELDMAHVERVLEVLKRVARAEVRIDLDEAHRSIELRIARKLRRVAVAEIREDQPQIVARRVRANGDFIAKRGPFGRLFETRAVGAETPAVVKAAQRVAVDPTGGELGAAMRTTRVDHDRSAARATIQREILTHDAQRRRLSRRKIRAVKHRLPKTAQVPAAERIAPAADFRMRVHRRPFTDRHRLDRIREGHVKRNER